MEIIEMNVKDLIPYEKNPRKNKDAVEYVAKSIEEFGFRNPVIIDKDNVIVAGHTRVLAAKKLGIKVVPCIMADDLTPEQIKAFRLADNKTAEFAKWDLQLLNDELSNILNIDMEAFGFSFDDSKTSLSEEYSLKVKIPQYEPVGAEVKIRELVDTDKRDELIREIDASDIPEDVKEFLRTSAYRHDVFNYKYIAEYYANADAKVQELFERSALVIIDIDDAIADGYCTLAEEIEEMRSGD